MAFLCALAFLTYFDRVCIVRAQPEIRADLHLTEPQMGAILGAFWLAYALFEIPGGWLGDRRGPRRTLTRIVLGWSLFTSLSGAAVGFTSLLACRFLFGAGEAGAFPNMAKVQSRWLPQRVQARAGGLLWLVARWGGAFSGVILGSILRLAARLHLGLSPWRFGFFLSGIVGLIWCCAFFPWFRDDPAEKESVNDAERTLIGADRPSAANAPATVPWGQLLASPSLWGLAALYFCGSFGWSFFVSWMPEFLLKVHGLTYDKSEWLSAAPTFFGGIACLVGGSLSDYLVRKTGHARLGRAILPVLGCLTAAVAMVGIRFVHTPRQAVVLMCVASAAYDLGQASNWASIIALGGRYAGTACGFMNMLGNFGNAVQPVVGALVFKHFGFGPLFALYAGAYVLAASTWLFIDPRSTFYGARAERGFPLD